MLLNRMVPFRLTPRADATFVNLTVTEQVAPAATVCPVQVSGPALLKNQVVGEPPKLLVIEIVPIPIGPVLRSLVKVTTPVPVLTPVGNVMVSSAGLTGEAT